MNEDAKKKEMYAAINAFAREKYDRIGILVPKGDKERYQQMAKKRGVTMSELARYALDRLGDDPE